MDRKFCRYCARILGEDGKCHTKNCPSNTQKRKNGIALYCPACGRVLINGACKNKACPSYISAMAAAKTDVAKNVVVEERQKSKQVRNLKKRKQVIISLASLVAASSIIGGTILYWNANHHQTDLTSSTANANIGIIQKNTRATTTTSVFTTTTTTVEETTAPPETTTVATTTTTEVADFGSTNLINGGYVWYDGDEYRVADNFYSNITIGEKLYYEEASTHYVYCCNRKDLSDKTLIYNAAYVDELTYYDGWFYFRRTLGDNVSICKMRTDGSDVTVLTQCNEWYMNVYQDKIYFVNFDNNYALQCMDLNGNQLVTLTYGASDICVVKDTIFFSNRDTRYLYKMNLDGTNLVQLNQTYTRCTNYYDGKLYYFGDNDHMIYRCDLMGNVEKSYESGANFLVLVGGYIYAYMDNAQIRKIAM